MNKKLALIALAGCAHLSSQAQSSTTIYGGLDLAPQVIQLSGGATPSTRMARLSSNSILGFRGSEDLGDGLRAIWQIEGSVGADNGESSLASRNTHVGLSGRLGTVFLGHWDTPYKSSTLLLDPFTNTRISSYVNITSGNSSANGGNLAARQSFARRQDNSIQYWSPNFGGVSFRLGASVNEEKTPAMNPWLASGSLAYRGDPIFLTYAYELHNQYGNGDARDFGHKIAGSYKLSDLTLAVSLERLKWQNGSLSKLVKGVVTPAGTQSLQLDSIFVAVTKRYGANAFIVTLGQDGGIRADGARLAQTGARSIVLNYTYNFSKSTEVYAELVELRNQANSANNFAINGVVGGVSAGTDLRGASVGLKMRF